MSDPAHHTVEAAGGVILRADRAVAAVHRPKWDDWSLPKGHLERHEDHATAALREVEEETGFVCSIVGTAPDTRYTDHRGRPKRVRWYVMEVVRGAFRANDEVDELRWFHFDGPDAFTYADDTQTVHVVWRATGSPLER